MYAPHLRIAVPDRALTLASDWLLTLRDRFAPKSTIKTYSSCLEIFYRFCHTEQLDPIDIGPAEIGLYLRAQREHTFAVKGRGRAQRAHLSPNTIRQRLTVIRLFYDHLLMLGVRLSNPVKRGHCAAFAGGKGGSRGLIKCISKEPLILSEEQWNGILSVAATTTLRNRLMLSLAYDSALRRCELCALKVNDIDLRRRSIRLRGETTKSGHPRSVAFSNVSAELLTSYVGPLHKARSAEGALFLSESRSNSGQPITVWTWSKIVRQIAMKSECHGLGTHTFRHLALSELAYAGWDLADISLFAGHRSPQSTLGYIHRSGRELTQKYAATIEGFHNTRLRQLQVTAA